ncbi:MAG: response regulator [Balneolales bacterium]|nr:response regulator [Balneolales bacterium]
MKVFNLILLVDDSEEDNFFHRRVLLKANVTKHIVECIDGEDAILYLKKEGKYSDWNKTYHIPDIIFLDINMPKVDGFEFLEAYKALPAEIKEGLIIVMISTSQNPKDQEKAKSYNEVADFITKPLDEEQIKKIIEQHYAKTIKA